MIGGSLPVGGVLGIGGDFMPRFSCAPSGWALMRNSTNDHLHYTSLEAGGLLRANNWLDFGFGPLLGGSLYAAGTGSIVS